MNNPLDQLDEDQELMARLSAQLDAYIEAQEHLELTTVGIDIGSSTSHLLFGRVVLEREAQDLSSRYVVVRRDVVWASPITLTPFTAAGNIDAEKLDAFIKQCYRDAGLAPEDIDSGAVILTGEAIKKHNAAAIDELFAEQAGKFVCATAGHLLEATLTAHGSGAVAYSQQHGTCVLHVDIGGGTTKLALIEDGVIRDVSAFAVGGRVVAADAAGVYSRIDDSAYLVGRDLGIPVDPQTFADEEVRRRVAARLADVVIDMIEGGPADELGRAMMLTPNLRRTAEPAVVTFAGGVAEYIFDREQAHFGDVAPFLAQELRARFRDRLKLPVADPGAGIRATVLGASQFTVQVSGKTIFVSDHGVLPLRNVPVARVELPERLDEAELTETIRTAVARLERDPDALLALSFSWNRAPEYAHLATLARAIAAAVTPENARTAPLVVMIDGDVGKTMGHILKDELGLRCELISIDGVDLRDFDYVDVGTLVDPPGVIPLVIKSLVFR